MFLFLFIIKITIYMYNFNKVYLHFIANNKWKTIYSEKHKKLENKAIASFSMKQCDEIESRQKTRIRSNSLTLMFKIEHPKDSNIVH